MGRKMEMSDTLFSMSGVMDMTWYRRSGSVYYLIGQKFLDMQHPAVLAERRGN